jgi:glycine cleavage system aminomethyltransferase T
VNKLPVGRVTSYAASTWFGKTVAIAQIKPQLAVNGNQIKVFDGSGCSLKSRKGIVHSRRFYSNFKKIIRT